MVNVAPNGLVEDADGIRYYANGVHQIGWQTIDGNELYFFNAPGLMCDYGRTIGGVYTEFEAFEYNGLTLYIKVEAVDGSEGLAYTFSDDGTYYIVSDIGTCTDTEIIIPETYNEKPVTAIGDEAFHSCLSIESIYYTGTVSQWSVITIGSNNYYLTSATVYYYTETQPTTEGNWWHYDENGKIVVW